MRRVAGRYVVGVLAAVGLIVGFSATSQAQIFQVGQTWDIQAAQLNPTQAIINGSFTVDSQTLNDPIDQENVFNSTLHFDGLTLPGTLDDQYGNSLLFMSYQNSDSSWYAQTATATTTQIADQYEFTTPSLGDTSGIFVATLRPNVVPLPSSMVIFCLGLSGMTLRLLTRQHSAFSLHNLWIVLSRL